MRVSAADGHHEDGAAQHRVAARGEQVFTDRMIRLMEMIGGGAAIGALAATTGVIVGAVVGALLDLIVFSWLDARAARRHT